MELKYSKALWRPLGAQTEPSIGVPRVLIVHTMVGNLAGTDAMFKRDGYIGTESTFGIGGPWETPSLDGVVYQWQELDHCADAQWDGNAYATSIETADGGNPNHPWTDKQLDALVHLAVWWCQQTHHPARLVTSPSDTGIGYHAQFPAWNKSAHTCPGAVRISQLREAVIPRAAGILKGGNGGNGSAVFTLRRYLKLTNPMMHGSDVVECQRKVRCTDDGWFGPATRSHVVAWQRDHNLIPDGVVGPLTCKSFGWHWAG
jgi:peptidoglycan hydrolase-like protein with peptidoglycan-binding domain